MIGVEPQLLQQVYDPNFWPRKVIFSRFDFRLGKRFLDQPQHKQGQPQEELNNSLSFLSNPNQE